MSSNWRGKETAVSWIRQNFPQGSTCLDVGPCDGFWFDVLGDMFVMDAVEIFEPNIETYHLMDKYRTVLHGDIADCEYNWYDLIIFGDVIEHMTVENAQKVIEYAKPRCHDMLIAVPFLYRQDALYGNPWERHIQEDLTQKVFSERYPGFRLLHSPTWNYAYYVKE